MDGVDVAGVCLTLYSGLRGDSTVRLYTMDIHMNCCICVTLKTQEIQENPRELMHSAWALHRSSCDAGCHLVETVHLLLDGDV